MGEPLKARVARVVAGGVHALLDRIEDQAPGAMLAQALREADGVIADVRHELGSVAAGRHQAQQQHAHLNREHETLSVQLEEALGRGREDLARAAVARQLDIEAQLPVLETTLADLARREAELRGYVEALLAKRREIGPDCGTRGPGLQQAAQLKELEELVRSNKIEERLAQLKAGRE